MTTRFAIILALAVSVLAGVAHAQTPPAVTEPAAIENEARRIFQRGQAHYNLNQFTEAAEDFEAAYRKLPRPLFLYNAALAHRLARNDERALLFYHLFLEADPKSKLRADVNDRIAELEKQIAANDASEAPLPSSKPTTVRDHETPKPKPTPPPITTAVALTPPSPAPVATPAPASQPELVATPVDHTPLARKWWLWTIVGGVVVVAVVVGVAVGVTESNGPSGPPAIHF